MHPYTTDNTTDERRRDDPDTMEREDYQRDEAQRDERYGEQDAGQRTGESYEQPTGQQEHPADSATGYHDSGTDQDTATGYHDSGTDRGTATGYDDTAADQDAATTHYAEPDTDRDGTAGQYDSVTDRDTTETSYAEPAGEVADHPAQTPAYAEQPGVTEQPTERSPQPVDEDWQLFGDEGVAALRTRWTEVQGSFVDDPRHAVEQAEQLVGEVVQSLTDRFNERRNELGGQRSADTEELRLALRRYRTFFQQVIGG